MSKNNNKQNTVTTENKKSVFKRKPFYITLIIAVALILAAIILIVCFRTEQDSVSSLISSVFVVVGVMAAVLAPIIDNIFQELRKKQDEAATYLIDISVTPLENNHVRFSASITNVGDKQIFTQAANLYIDQGIAMQLDSAEDTKNAVRYKFPFILRHREMGDDGRPDCVLCTKCKKNDLEYPDDDKDVKEFFEAKDCGLLLRSNVPLLHLSKPTDITHGSIQYIYPKERFSEDIVLQFKQSGVYRVTFVVTTSKG